MTREDQYKALRRIVNETGEIMKSIEGPAVRVLAGSIALLVVIIDAQGKRLDAIERCKAGGAADMPRVWQPVGDVVKRRHCPAEKE